ncbi:MAG: 4-(cytidine 5'-diphospho)-2-C-methyl-D-erythritol kinase [Hyphomicrobiaceae bacterium]
MAQRDSEQTWLSELAPAKINLTLRVLGRRPDGYHELESLVVFADECASDRLDFQPGGPFRLALSGSGAEFLSGEASTSNLVARAVEAARRVAPEVGCGLFRLEKRLPVAAGIGGGSADAAAALRLVRRAGAGRLDDIRWSEIASMIGADVPVCLASRAAAMSGLGERVSLLSQFPRLWAVLANPRVPLSTGQVFAELDAEMLPAADEAATPQPVPQFSDLDELLRYVVGQPNDLEAAAMRLCAAIGEVQSALASLDGALVVRMSGSGPTCFALFADQEAAADGARKLAQRRPDWWIVATTLQ